MSICRIKQAARHMGGLLAVCGQCWLVAPVALFAGLPWLEATTERAARPVVQLLGDTQVGGRIVKLGEVPADERSNP